MLDKVTKTRAKPHLNAIWPLTNANDRNRGLAQDILRDTLTYYGLHTKNEIRDTLLSYGRQDTAHALLNTASLLNRIKWLIWMVIALITTNLMILTKLI